MYRNVSFLFYFQFKTMQLSSQFIFIEKICQNKWNFVWYCFNSLFYCFRIFIRYFLKISHVVPIFSQCKDFFHNWWRYTINNLVSFVISTCKFLWWIDVSLHLVSALLKLLWLSPLPILKDLSHTLLIKLLDFLGENIHFSGQ